MVNSVQLLRYIRKRQPTIEQIKEQFNVTENDERFLDTLIRELIDGKQINWFVDQLGRTIYYYRLLEHD
jgi:hypothetical protein